MIEFHPDTADHKLTWHFLRSNLAWIWQKMTELYLRYCRPEYDLIFFLISDLAWTWEKVIDPTQVLQTRISPKIFLLSDLAWTWWKVIELHPGTVDQKLT